MWLLISIKLCSFHDQDQRGSFVDDSLNKVSSFGIVKFKLSLNDCEGDLKFSSHALSLDIYEAFRNPVKKLLIEQKVVRKLLFIWIFGFVLG